MPVESLIDFVVQEYKSFLVLFLKLQSAYPSAIEKNSKEKIMRPTIVSLAAALVLATCTSTVEAETVFGFPYKGALRIQVPDRPSATSAGDSTKKHSVKPKKQNRSRQILRRNQRLDRVTHER
jgi:hypothetical protein